jgi:hypothetical protein
MQILSAIKLNDKPSVVNMGCLDLNNAVGGVRPPAKRGGKRKKDKITDKHA